MHLDPNSPSSSLNVRDFIAVCAMNGILAGDVDQGLTSLQVSAFACNVANEMVVYLQSNPVPGETNGNCN